MVIDTLNDSIANAQDAQVGSNKGKKTFALEMLETDWAEALKKLGQPAFRSKQIVDWIFAKNSLDPNGFSNLPPTLRVFLSENFNWSLPNVLHQHESSDGSTKLLLQFPDTLGVIESVILRYEDRVSLCVSSQVGCKLACSFCQTGKLGFMRNLSAGEILSQFWFAKQILLKEGRRLSHVVFMGMGEPLDNFDNTVRSAEIMTGSPYFGISHRHVTVSTSGITPKIEQLADRVRVALAVSLHAAEDSLRTELMPINRKYNLEELKKSLLRYQEKTGDKITIEYILIREKNCSEKHALALVKFLQGLSAKVNLIPFNAHPGLPYERPSEDEIHRFQHFLSSRSIPAPIRYSKGLEISAACGQLAAKTEALFSPPKRDSLKI